MKGQWKALWKEQWHCQPLSAASLLFLSMMLEGVPRLFPLFVREIPVNTKLRMERIGNLINGGLFYFRSPEVLLEGESRNDC